MIDDAIIEAAARRLAKLTGSPDHEFFRGFVSAVLAEATPLIEAAALERAAKVALDGSACWTIRREIAADIRAMIVTK